MLLFLDIHIDNNNFMEKILTIVVPTFNMEKYLHRCLDSLIIQNEMLFTLVEVMVVNDGSKDRSSAIAHEYEGRFPHIFRVIDKENGNYGSCVNRGIREARGQYFRILDADDFFENHAIEELVEFIVSLNEKPDLIITNFREDYETRKSHVGNDIGGYQYNIIYNADSVNIGQGSMSIMHRMTYRTEIVRESGLCHLEGISYTDSEYCFYPLSKVRTIIFANILLYCYQHGRDEQTVSLVSMQKNIHQLYLIIDKMLNTIGSSDGKIYYNTNSKAVLMRNLSIYYTTLLTNDFPNSEKLTELDDRLKDNFYPLYIQVGGLRKSFVPFVSLWRKGVNTKSSMYRFFYNSYDSFKLLAHKLLY